MYKQIFLLFTKLFLPSRLRCFLKALKYDIHVTAKFLYITPNDLDMKFVLVTL